MADFLKDTLGISERVFYGNARFERCHLKILADFALQFELSYFVQQPKINSLLDLQQAVNFRIIDELRRTGVEFAYPTQRVLIGN
jgi:small-conductance mechanosensitive channel